MAEQRSVNELERLLQEALDRAEAAERERQEERQRAERVLRELYPEPSRVPDRHALSHKALCWQVNERLKNQQQPPIKPDTILRAAGRRK